MGRLWYLDVLRVVSMAAVVIIHASAPYWLGLDVSSAGWAIANLFDGALRWAVPVFVMISGALFLDPMRPQPIKKLYTKNIAGIMSVILFWGLVYALVAQMDPSSQPESARTFIRSWLLGHYHMWFLFMIAGLYILVPILRCITANRAVMGYFLVIAFLINIVLPFLTGSGHFSLLAQVVSKLLIQLPVGYSFYFVLGYWLASAQIDRRFRWMPCFLAAGGVALTVGLTWAASQRAAEGVETYFEYLSLPVCLSSAGIFLLARYFGHGLQKKQSHPILNTLSASTLGVYMVHILVLNGLSAIGVGFPDLGVFPGILFSAGSGIVISFAIALVLKRVPFFGEHCV